jgi:hypothetical protein
MKGQSNIFRYRILISAGNERLSDAVREKLVTDFGKQ